jgi:hypothetical protein
MKKKITGKRVVLKTPELAPVKPKRKYVRKVKPEVKPMSHEIHHAKHSAKVGLQPYPTTLDLTQFLTDAMAFFRGQGDKAKIVHDAYEALGYGLGKFIPDEVTGENPLRFHSPQTFFALGNPECADAIDRALNHPDTGIQKAAAGSAEWHALLSLAIQAAIKIVNQHLGFQ